MPAKTKEPRAQLAGVQKSAQIQSFRLIALFGLVQFASQNLRTRTSVVCMIEDLY